MASPPPRRQVKVSAVDLPERPTRGEANLARRRSRSHESKSHWGFLLAKCGKKWPRNRAVLSVRRQRVKNGRRRKSGCGGGTDCGGGAAADKHNEIIASALGSFTRPLPLLLKRDRRRLLVIRLPPRMDEPHAWDF